MDRRQCQVLFKRQLQVFAGVLPIMLLFGGGLALYLGFDELNDTWKKDSSPADMTMSDDSEKYKQEIVELKKEIDSLKTVLALSGHSGII